MGCLRAITQCKGSLFHWFFFFATLLYCFRGVVAVQIPLKSSSLISTAVLADSPSSGLFDPIEISPSVIPHYPIPAEPLPPMYPSFPTTYEPVLTGNCTVNFSAISTIMEKTAEDCAAPLAPLVGNVICCPQVNSLLHIFQGYYSVKSDELVLPKGLANDCFLDIISILSSRGANSTIDTLCSVNSLNLTGGSCPVKDATTFEKMVNTSKLLEDCSSVDPLKECCRPTCQPAIVEAALHISATESTISANADVVGESSGMNALNDCKGVVYSWLSRKLSLDAANTAFRILSSCKVNKACPLEFKQPSEVIKACRDLAAPNPSCCSSLNTYIVGIQKQMLITNRQAINCATLFGSMLQKGGVMTNIYELCDVDLKDFSLQGRFIYIFLLVLFPLILCRLIYFNCLHMLSNSLLCLCFANLRLIIGVAFGQEGCLLRSLPADVVYDNSTGISFTCDLSDNIAAPWPSSSSLSSLSLCAHEMSLPALPTSETSGNPGCFSGRFGSLIPIFWFFLSSILNWR